MLCSKNSDQLPELNISLTDIFAVGKVDYGVMVRYQNLTWKSELFRAPLGPGPGTMYPVNPPLAGPDHRRGSKGKTPTLWAILVSFWKKWLLLMPFGLHFARFKAV